MLLKLFHPPLLFLPSLPPLGNGHWRTQARHHLLHHGGCVHHQRRRCTQQAQAGGDQRCRSVKQMRGGFFFSLHLWFVSRRRSELFWGFHVSDRLWGLQYPYWAVCLSFSNEIPEANVCTLQSHFFIWTLSLVTTTRHTSLTRPLEPVWKLAALAWTRGRLPGSMKAFFQKIEGSTPV